MKHPWEGNAHPCQIAAAPRMAAGASSSSRLCWESSPAPSSCSLSASPSCFPSREGGESLVLPEVQRGSILDRQGRILAVTTRMQRVSVWTPSVTNAEETASELARILGMEPAAVLDTHPPQGRLRGHQAADHSGRIGGHPEAQDGREARRGQAGERFQQVLSPGQARLARRRVCRRRQRASGRRGVHVQRRAGPAARGHGRADGVRGPGIPHHRPGHAVHRQTRRPGRPWRQTSPIPSPSS